METTGRKVVYKTKADSQIFKIILYIDKKGYPETAEKYIKRLYEFGNSIAIFPNKFPICKHIQNTKKKFHCAVFEDNYIFIYKVIRSRIIIYNVIHCSRMR